MVVDKNVELLILSASPYIDVPRAPVNIQLIGLGSRVANITWQDGVSPIPGNPPVDFYDVLLFNDSSNASFTTFTEFISLNQLLPFTNYSITITAVNRIGSSNDSEPFSFKTNEERKYFFDHIYKIDHTITTTEFYFIVYIIATPKYVAIIQTHQ